LEGKLKKRFRENGLTIVVSLLFLASLVGQTITGFISYNDEQEDHQQPTISIVEYLGTGHFIEAVFENWESEFLQMGVFVMLTSFLRQKGSPESKKMEGKEDVDADPREPKEKNRKGAPWPVLKGGTILKLYEYSLSLTLFALFIICVALHAYGGAREYSADQILHGGQAVSTFEYLTTSRMWFESFQNWQSEFLSIGVLIVLSIFLRHKGSPESKPVAHPHFETGRE